MIFNPSYLSNRSRKVLNSSYIWEITRYWFGVNKQNPWHILLNTRYITGIWMQLSLLFLETRKLWILIASTIHFLSAPIFSFAISLIYIIKNYNLRTLVQIHNNYKSNLLMKVITRLKPFTSEQYALNSIADHLIYGHSFGSSTHFWDQTIWGHFLYRRIILLSGNLSFTATNVCTRIDCAIFYCIVFTVE